MKKMTIFIIVFVYFFRWEAKGQNYEIISPDRKITVLVEADKSLSYIVKY